MWIFYCTVPSGKKEAHCPSSTNGDATACAWQVLIVEWEIQHFIHFIEESNLFKDTWTWIQILTKCLIKKLFTSITISSRDKVWWEDAWVEVTDNNNAPKVCTNFPCLVRQFSLNSQLTIWYSKFCLLWEAGNASWVDHFVMLGYNQLLWLQIMGSDWLLNYLGKRP
jgi:hypothetical protein